MKSQRKQQKQEQIDIEACYALKHVSYVNEFTLRRLAEKISLIRQIVAAPYLAID